MRTIPSIALVVALLIPGGVAVACTSSSTASSSTTPTTTICTQKDALQSSVQALTHVDVVKNGTSSLKSAVDTVQSDGQALIGSIKEEFRPEATNLQTSLAQLRTSTQQVGSTGINGITAAVKSIQDATNALVQKVNAKKCS